MNTTYIKDYDVNRVLEIEALMGPLEKKRVLI